eukprot:1551442-Amphidinium_carterae.1
MESLRNQEEIPKRIELVICPGLRTSVCVGGGRCFKRAVAAPSPCWICRMLAGGMAICGRVIRQNVLKQTSQIVHRIKSVLVVDRRCEHTACVWVMVVCHVSVRHEKLGQPMWHFNPFDPRYMLGSRSTFQS